MEGCNMNKELEYFTNGCIEALYFTDTGDSDQPESNAIMDEDSLLRIKADCHSWWARFGCYVMSDACICKEEGISKAIKAGRDFWYTRNHHGVGFWDGDWSDNYAEIFTEGSICYGEIYVTKGDDGKIYLE
jgi:hypothetical protein